MTRKDYIVIAAALRESIDKLPRQGMARIGAEHAAASMSEHLADHYPNFNTARFLDACGVETE